MESREGAKGDLRTTIYIKVKSTNSEGHGGRQEESRHSTHSCTTNVPATQLVISAQTSEMQKVQHAEPPGTKKLRYHPQCPE